MSAVCRCFEVSEDRPAIANCQLCQVKVFCRVSKFRNITTSNVIKHLKSRHPKREKSSVQRRRVINPNPKIWRIVTFYRGQSSVTSVIKLYVSQAVWRCPHGRRKPLLELCLSVHFEGEKNTKWEMIHWSNIDICHLNQCTGVLWDVHMLL